MFFFSDSKSFFFGGEGGPFKGENKRCRVYPFMNGFTYLKKDRGEGGTLGGVVGTK